MLSRFSSEIISVLLVFLILCLVLLILILLIVLLIILLVVLLILVVFHGETLSLKFLNTRFIPIMPHLCRLILIDKKF